MSGHMRVTAFLATCPVVIDDDDDDDDDDDESSTDVSIKVDVFWVS